MNPENKNKVEHSTSDLEAEYNFPKNLSPMDIKLVLDQCKIQHATSKEEIEGFAAAYSLVKDLTSKEKIELLKSSDEVRKLVFELGRLIEKNNQIGFRKTPVRFGNFNTAVDPRLIEQSIQSFSEIYVDFIANPQEDERLNCKMLYQEFEKIHPFKDGNGRVGDLLWKIATRAATDQWPEELPPNVFGEDRSMIDKI